MNKAKNQYVCLLRFRRQFGMFVIIRNFVYTKAEGLSKQKMVVLNERGQVSRRVTAQVPFHIPAND